MRSTNGRPTMAEHLSAEEWVGGLPVPSLQAWAFSTSSPGSASPSGSLLRGRLPREHQAFQKASVGAG